MAKEIKHQQLECCYNNWIAQQRLDLHELLQSLTLRNSTDHDDFHKLIAKKIVNHFENYHTAPAQVAKHHAPSLFSPTWGSTFENSLLWIGGCRPSLFIRIVYSLCGSQVDDAVHVTEGAGKYLREISSSQLKSIDALHSTNVKEENNLNSRFASLQERIADEPLALLAIDCRELVESKQVDVVKKAMDTYALDLYNVLVEADKLRLDILKGMIDILTPLQAIELLVASNKLQLSLHEWSKRRDIRMGITRFLNKN